jgi:saccharopine dehydrogenase-like NADP-dependent oxidoreductase
MFDKWQLKDGEADFTVMLVELECLDVEKKVKHSYYLLDDYDHEQNITSMARTTGYTAAIVARQVLKGEFKQPGINPPEYVGRVDGCFLNLLAEYEKRNIKVTETIS